jgi:hypothetical protein
MWWCAHRWLLLIRWPIMPHHHRLNFRLEMWNANDSLRIWSNIPALNFVCTCTIIWTVCYWCSNLPSSRTIYIIYFKTWELCRRDGWKSLTWCTNSSVQYQ